MDKENNTLKAEMFQRMKEQIERDELTFPRTYSFDVEWSMLRMPTNDHDDVMDDLDDVHWSRYVTRWLR